MHVCQKSRHLSIFYITTSLKPWAERICPALAQKEKLSTLSQSKKREWLRGEANRGKGAERARGICHSQCLQEKKRQQAHEALVSSSFSAGAIVKPWVPWHLSLERAFCPCVGAWDNSSAGRPMGHRLTGACVCWWISEVRGWPLWEEWSEGVILPLSQSG